MGNESKCAVRIAGMRHEGKALLESSELIFRGGECRVRIPFREILGLTAAEGELRVETKAGVTVFEVGPLAEKWREKILHPKSRAEKLGIKAGMKISIDGQAEEEFLAELKKSGADIVKERDPEMIFLAVSGKSGLAAVRKSARAMHGAAALWIVYPKGNPHITENDVLSAGRKAGLKDVKVVGFSATHTALKFVIPVAKR